MSPPLEARSATARISEELSAIFPSCRWSTRLNARLFHTQNFDVDDSITIEGEAHAFAVAAAQGAAVDCAGWQTADGARLDDAAVTDDQGVATIGQSARDGAPQLGQCLGVLCHHGAVLRSFGPRRVTGIPLNYRCHFVAHHAELFDLFVDGIAHGDGRFKSARQRTGDYSIEFTQPCTDAARQINAGLREMSLRNVALSMPADFECAHGCSGMRKT